MTATNCDLRSDIHHCLTLVKNLRGSLRIFKDLQRSAKTCKRSLQMRIFQGSLKDLWKIFEDLHLAKVGVKILKEAVRILWGSCKDPCDNQVYGLGEDPSGSSTILWGSFKDLKRILQVILKRSWLRSLKIQLRSLKDLWRIFKGSCEWSWKDLHQDLWRCS